MVVQAARSGHPPDCGALAPVERAAGNPMAGRIGGGDSAGTIEVPRPASSAVGMFQTRTAPSPKPDATASMDPIVVEDGPKVNAMTQFARLAASG